MEISRNWFWCHFFAWENLWNFKGLRHWKGAGNWNWEENISDVSCPNYIQQKPHIESPFSRHWPSIPYHPLSIINYHNFLQCTQKRINRISTFPLLWIQLCNLFIKKEQEKRKKALRLRLKINFSWRMYLKFHYPGKNIVCILVSYSCFSSNQTLQLIEFVSYYY